MMKRFAIDLETPQNKMDSLHIFRMRLHLLIIMVKAKLKGYPVGELRKEAVLENAARLHQDLAKADIKFPGTRTSTHLFKERVRLLSVMATAIISDDYPLGIHRREAVLDNIEIIIETAFPKQDLPLFYEILMAA